MSAAAPRPLERPVLEAAGIVNRFGRQVVHQGVSVEVRRGEILGVAGGSGSGKSVLMRTLAGLHRPDAGEVRIEGKPVGALRGRERAATMGVLFQQGALFSSLTVAQNVMLPLRLHARLPAADEERIAAMKLALAGLPAESAAKLPSELSGGMVKRAALARALALDPRIVFLDEPTSGLDPPSAGGIDELVLRLNESLGITFVVVTHDLTTLFTICHRVAALNDGGLVVDTVEALMRSGPPSIRELLRGPRAEGALAARNRIHGNR